MINGNVYKEVYELLSYMDKVTVMKIPIELLNKIKENKNDEYISRIDKEDIFNRNNVLPETIKYIAWLDVNYWETREEKERLRRLYFKKINEQNEIKKNKFSSSDLFKKEKSVVNNKITKDVELIEYKKYNCLTSILNKIKNIVGKIRNKNMGKK